MIEDRKHNRAQNCGVRYRLSSILYPLSSILLLLAGCDRSANSDGTAAPAASQDGVSVYFSPGTDCGQLIIGSFNFSDRHEESTADNVVLIENKAKLMEAYEGNFRAHLAHSKKSD